MLHIAIFFRKHTVRLRQKTQIGVKSPSRKISKRCKVAIAKNLKKVTDFLVSKTKLTRRHNISPIEVKSGKNITHASLDKFAAKYSQWCADSFLFYGKDLRVADGITYLPHYMTPLL